MGLYRLFRLLSFLILSHLLGEGILHAQSNQALFDESVSKAYTIDHYTVENGLPQNSISGFHYDELGFLWLATQGGLVRFDGQSFKIYDQQNYPHFKSRRMSSIQQHPNDSTYVFDSAGGTHLIHQGHLKPSPQLNHDKSVPRRKNIYYGELTSEDVQCPSGISYLDQMLQLLDCYLPPGNFFPVGSDGDGYILSDHIISYYEDFCLSTVTNLTFAQFTSESINKRPAAFLFEKKLYVIDEDFGIHIYEDGKQVAFSEVFISQIHTDKLSFDTPNQLFFCNATTINELPYFNIENVLYKFTVEQGQLGIRKILSGARLQVNQFVGVLPGGNLIITTFDDGFYILRKKLFNTTYDPSDSLHQIVSCPLELNDGRVICHPHTIFSNKVISHWNWEAARAVFAQLPDGSLYQQTHWNIFKIDSNWVYKKINKHGSEFIQHIIADLRGRIWTISPYEIGFVENNIYRTRLSLSRELPYTMASRFSIDSTLWLGTMQGIYFIDKTMTQLSFLPGTEGLEVRWFNFTEDGAMWFSTYNKGFFRYKNDVLFHFPTDRDGHLTATHCLFEDQNGLFWASTNNGLYQFSRNDLERYADQETDTYFYRYYDQSYGFATNEFNGGTGAAIRLQDSSLLMPSMKGLVYFNPESIDPPDAASILLEVYKDGVDISSLDHPIIERDYERLRFRMYAPFYGHPKNIQVRYKLDRQNEDQWHNFDEEQYVDYTDLKGGLYIFKVRRYYGFGENNFTEIAYSFDIAKTFTETGYFWLLIAVIIASAVWIMTYFRFAYLRHANKQLEQKVIHRTEALRKSLEKLEISEAHLNNKNIFVNRLLSIITHDIRASLKFISSLSRTSRNQSILREEAKSQHNFTHIWESSKTLSHLVDQMLSWSKLQQGRMTPAPEIVLPHEIIQEVINLLQPIYTDKGHTLIHETKMDIKITVDRFIFRSILQNILENELKHNDKSQIRIYDKMSTDFYTANITTSNRIDVSELNAVINNTEISDDKNIMLTEGIGLYIISEMARKANIKIQYRETDSGHAVDISIPL